MNRTAPASLKLSNNKVSLFPRLASSHRCKQDVPSFCCCCCQPNRWPVRLVQHTLADNVELTDPILQRFDTLCVFQDTVDPVADERLARFVTSSHMRSTPSNELPPGEDNVRTDVVPDGDGDLDMISQELLRKDIPYARAQVPPVMHSSSLDEENDSVSLYVALRRESHSSGGVSAKGYRAVIPFSNAQMPEQP